MVNDEMVNVINPKEVTVGEDVELSARPVESNGNSITFPTKIKKFGTGGLHVTIPTKYTDMIGAGDGTIVYITIKKMEDGEQ